MGDKAVIESRNESRLCAQQPQDKPLPRKITYNGFRKDGCEIGEMEVFGMIGFFFSLRPLDTGVGVMIQSAPERTDTVI